MIGCIVTALLFSAAADPLAKPVLEAWPPERCTARYLPFECLSDETNLSELEARFQLPPPNDGTKAHEKGTQLVLLAIKRGPLSAGRWFGAVGTLGIDSLELGTADKEGFDALFSSHFASSEMEALVHMHIGLLLQSSSMIRRPSDQLRTRVAKRYAALQLIAYALESRFRSSDEGDFGCEPHASSRPNWAKKARNAFGHSLAIFREMANVGFIDPVLRDALGVLHAAMRLDGLSFESFPELRAPALYDDALQATLEVDKKSKCTSAFFSSLAFAMRSRELSTVLTDIYMEGATASSFVQMVRSDLALGPATHSLTK